MKIHHVGAKLLLEDGRTDGRTGGRTDGRTDRQTEMAKLILTPRNFETVPIKNINVP